MTERKLPFECMILDTEAVEVKNPFSGQSCMLEPDEIAVYDCITGANLTGDYDMVRKGLDWFRKYNPTAYMILLD